jgi:D-alanyl-D-alanine dipeptidase
MSSFSLHQVRPADIKDLSSIDGLDWELSADYAGNKNFTGQIVPGYLRRSILLTEVAMEALAKVQRQLQKESLKLVIFDGYRPHKAVTFFQKWANLPETRWDLKQLYYPTLERQELFSKGYLAKQSSHSRGSTVDLSIADKNNLLWDMGTRFDFFHELSHTQALGLSSEVREKRAFLVALMREHGFRNYSQEWWHFTLNNEPYRDKYFDFDII